MNDTPNFHIGDASPDSAFLTNSEGYDIAVLHPITAEDGHKLTPEQWQGIINLINAAPQLLQELNETIATLRGCFQTVNVMNRIQSIRNAITKATTA